MSGRKEKVLCSSYRVPGIHLLFSRQLAVSCSFQLLWDSRLNFHHHVQFVSLHFSEVRNDVCNLIHFISQKFHTHHRNIQTKNCNYPFAKHKVFINMMIYFLVRLLSLLKSWRLLIHTGCHLKIHYDPQGRHSIAFPFYSKGYIWKAYSLGFLYEGGPM